MIAKPTDQPSVVVVVVRLATVGEAAEIAFVLRQAFVEFEALYAPEAFAATTPTTEQIQSRWNEGPVWIGLQASQSMGTVAAKPEGSALYVRSMAILSQARGHGLGKLLLEQVEAFAIEQGLHRLHLSTTPFLHNAIRLYEQFGFQQTSEGPHKLWGTALFTMEKWL